MLSKQERRFVRIWEEQRRGTKVGYYVLYISIWFFVAMLGLFFMFNNFTDIYRNKLSTLYQMIAIAIIISTTATHLTYRYNEKQFKKIIRREMGNTMPEQSSSL